MTFRRLIPLSLVALAAAIVPTTAAAAVVQCDGHSATIVGTSGNDRLIGTDGDDVIVGLAGNDVILGGEGEDIICGGDGDDRIRGQQKSDVIFGGNGDDTIQGNWGKDEIYGGNGHDIIDAGFGDDTVSGGSGADWLRGGNHVDTVNGDDGEDDIGGGNGHDTLNGGRHADIIRGGNGRDTLYGDSGHDIINSGAHADVIFGGDGNDDIRTGGSVGDQTNAVVGDIVDGVPVAAPVTTTTATPAVAPTVTETTAAPTTTVPDTTSDSYLTEEEFEKAIEAEIHRLLNCARTGDYSTWCEAGDETGWNVTAVERDGAAAKVRTAALDAESANWASAVMAQGNDSPAQGIDLWDSSIIGTPIREMVTLFGGNVQHTPDVVDVAAKFAVDKFMESPERDDVILLGPLTDRGVGVEVGQVNGRTNFFVVTRSDETPWREYLATTTTTTKPPTTTTTTVPVTTTTTVPTLTEAEFEAAVADEVFRLVNCARTGDYSAWCEQGDETEWDVAAEERSGLEALERSTSLDDAAKTWAETMATEGYLPSPYPPEGGAKENRTTAWRAADLTADGVHLVAKRMMDQAMASTSRRPNIVSDAFGRFGSGLGFVSTNSVYGVQYFGLDLTAEDNGSVGTPPTCVTRFHYAGFDGCEGIAEGLPVKFFPLADGAQVQRVAVYFHGDGANGYHQNYGFDPQILEWAQKRDILVLGVLSPATYDSGLVAYGAAQPEHAGPVATAIESFIEAYDVVEDTNLFWGASGGSWFLSSSFIAHNGYRLPGVYVANCGGSGSTRGWDWNPVTQTEVKDQISVYFNYGTEDFLAESSADSHLEFDQLGFTTDELVHDGALHCRHPIAAPTIEFWERHVS